MLQKVLLALGVFDDGTEVLVEFVVVHLSATQGWVIAVASIHYIYFFTMFYERKKLLTIPATTDLVIITQKNISTILSR